MRTHLSRFAVSVSETEAYVVDAWQDWALVTTRLDRPVRRTWMPTIRHCTVVGHPDRWCVYLGAGRYRIGHPLDPPKEATGPNIDGMKAPLPQEDAA